MSDIADISANAVIKPERGNRWRFVAASKRCKAVATEFYELNSEAVFCANAAFTSSTFGKDFSLNDSVGCCGCVVHLNHPDWVPNSVWWRVSYFFDRDGKEANVFVWSEPERTFFRRSFEWFNKRKMWQ